MRRRGSIFVLIIAVLALLFIIGVTLLVVAGLDRRSALQARSAKDMREADRALKQNALQQLRLDVVGSDGVPYNGEWK